MVADGGRIVRSRGWSIVRRAGGGSVGIASGRRILLTWGLLIGLGTGSMALVFAATIANTWFAKSRGQTTFLYRILS